MWASSLDVARRLAEAERGTGQARADAS
jgi:hypothetical protein